MPIPNSTPIRWVPKGLTDAGDGTNSFPGAMQTLTNLIPDPSTAGLFVPRPAAQRLTDFTGGPAVVGFPSGILTVGDLEYGMVPSSRNVGNDEPFVYDLENQVYLPVSGITNVNTPASPPAGGDWTPPIIAQIGGRIIVTHPGFQSGTAKFGWFDVSGFSEVTLGNTHTSTLIDGNPSVLGVQPGMTVAGAGIPAGTSVISTTEFVLTTAGDLLANMITNLQAIGVPILGLAVGQDVAGFGIPVGTTVKAVTTTPHATTGDTHSSTVLDNIVPIQGFTIAFGQAISGAGIPANTTVASVSNIVINTNGTINGTTTVHVGSGAGIVANMTVTGQGIPALTLVVSNTPFSLATHGNIVAGSGIVTNIPSTVGLAPGQAVTCFAFGGAVIGSVDSPTQVTLSSATQFTLNAIEIVFTGATIVMNNAATTSANFVSLTFGSLEVIMSLPATASAAGTAVTFTTFGVTLDQASLLAVLTHIDVTFSGATITLSQAAIASANGVSLTIAGGTAAAPLWGAGDCDRNGLPSVPVGVAQFNGRAYFADGLDGIPFSDSGFPCRRSNTPNVQALTTNDGLPITAIGPLLLSSPITGGIVQALIAFEGDGAMRQITGDMAFGTLSMNLLPIATGTNSPLSIIPCLLGLAFVSPQGLRFVRPDGSVTSPVGADGQGVTHPVQYAKFPSRICAEANVSVLRISLQHGSEPGEPFQEFWFDLTRQTWSGPHTFPARLIQHWRKTFVIVPIFAAPGLWQSDTVGPHFGGGTAADFIENGTQLSWVTETVLLPDNSMVAMNAMVEANLTCSGLVGPTGHIRISAFDEQGVILDGVELIFAPPDFLLSERALHWHEPIIFKQMSMRVTGFSNSSVRIGNAYMRYEILGYSKGLLDQNNYLLADDGVTFVTDDSGNRIVVVSS